MGAAPTKAGIRVRRRVWILRRRGMSRRMKRGACGRRVSMRRAMCIGVGRGIGFRDVVELKEGEGMGCTMMMYM
jgi:hypothetical protein